MQNEPTWQELNTAYDEAFHIITKESSIYAMATLFVVFDNGPLVLRHQRCSQAPSGDRVGRRALNRLFPGFTSLIHHSEKRPRKSGLEVQLVNM